MKNGMKIGVNKFVQRQDKDSKFSHFEGEGGFETVTALADAFFDQAKQGYKDGVLLVPVPAEGFFSGVVEVTSETALKATFEARRPEETPFISVVAVGAQKLPAKFVELVLYRGDVLGSDATTDCEWELISINARPTEEEEPPTPMAMARNFLELPGGTKAEYTAEEFAKAIAYWSGRVMAG